MTVVSGNEKFLFIMINENRGGAVQKTHRLRRVRKSDFRHHLFIESFGVKIGFTSNTADGIEDIRKMISQTLAGCSREIEATETDHHFKLVRNFSGKDSLYKDGEKFFTQVKREHSLDPFGSKLRITVAEFAVEKVFIHSGAVCWKNKAIIFPAQTFSGKTALTAALVKRGAIYYSDEYAVLDRDGLLHPFPKTLSIRGEIDDKTQVEYTVESLGGKSGTKKVPVGMVLITEYKPNAVWKPEILTPANGIMKIIKNTLPIRNDPNFVLNVLTQMTNRAVIVKSRRGDVEKSADSIIDFFESNCLLS